MQKVCKVVLNSVSHDARVLKEASAIRDCGYNVTIIGIQDANNSTPIEILDNGVVIRRVAWSAKAVKPSILYLAASLLVIGIGIFLLINYYDLLTDFLVNYFEVSDLKSIMFHLGNLLILVSSILLIRRFRVSSSRHNRVQTNESNLQLKYVESINLHENRGSSDSTHVPSNNSRVFRSPLRWRPLMCGISSLFSVKNYKKWRAVFARESGVLELLTVENPHIIHAHDLSALPICSRYKARNKIKLIFDAHEIYDHLAQASDIIASINSKILKTYSTSVDFFITINASIANYYKRFYPDLPAAYVIKNATIPSTNYNYDGRLHDAAGLDINRKIIIYQGGFARNRGLVDLLLSAEHLDDNWSIVFMGWGNLEDELKRIHKALVLKKPALNNSIKFIPKVKHSELVYWSSGATIGIIPYENTGLNHWYCNPNKLWEYPNASVPILVSPFPELTSYVDQYEIGWLLGDPITPQGIADKVNSLTDEEIHKAKIKCDEFIKKDNWSVYEQVLRNLYDEL